MTDTITVEVTLPAVIARKWHDTEFLFTADTASESFKAKIFDYGLRYFNDTYAKLGDLPSEKIAILQDGVNLFNSGADWEGRSKGGSAALPSHMALALSNAKDVLKIRFKKITGKGRIAEQFAAHESVAGFFTETEGRFTWNDTRVFEWIDAEKARGGADYIGEAERELTAVKNMMDIDVSDLL